MLFHYTATLGNLTQEGAKQKGQQPHSHTDSQVTSVGLCVNTKQQNNN